MAGPPPKKPGGMSLYANLLKTDNDSATISGAPVKYDLSKQSAADEEAEKRKKDASLKFQPIKRPQVQQKAKPRVSSSSAQKVSSSTVPSASSPDKQSTPTQAPPQPAQRSNFENWVGDPEEDEYFLGLQERPHRDRGGKRGRQKKRRIEKDVRTWDWDDIYDPTVPNNYADYKGSEEQYREISEWKDRLYYRPAVPAAGSTAAAAARPDTTAADGGLLAQRIYNENLVEIARLKSANDRLGSSASSQSPSRVPTAAAAAAAATHNRRKVKANAAKIARLERANDQFTAAVPPAPFSFAPPRFDEPTRPPAAAEDDDDDHYPPMPTSSEHTRESAVSPAPPVPATVDATGEDAYSRHMHMAAPIPYAPPSDNQVAATSVTAQQTASVSPSANITKAAADIAAKKAEAQAKLAAFKAKLAAKGQQQTNLQTSSPAAFVPAQSAQPPPPVQATQQPSVPTPPPPSVEPGVIAKGPVRYNNPPPPLEDPAQDDVDATMDAEPLQGDAPKSNRPGQKGFAQRYLEKYGYQKGKGLGAEGNEGITTAIIAQAEKRKKKSDAEGGGWVAPRNMGRLVGGKRRKIEGQDGAGEGGADGRGGELSVMVKLEGMLKDLDVDHEIQENNLMQEIGDEFGREYGTVERLFIWRAKDGGNEEVFVKFTSQLSALKAIKECDGMTFADNEVVARFWPLEKFERGVFV